jgi:hypothetical protein
MSDPIHSDDAAVAALQEQVDDLRVELCLAQGEARFGIALAFSLLRCLKHRNLLDTDDIREIFDTIRVEQIASRDADSAADELGQAAEESFEFELRSREEWAMALCDEIDHGERGPIARPPLLGKAPRPLRR